MGASSRSRQNEPPPDDQGEEGSFGHAMQAITKGIELFKQNKVNFANGTDSFYVAEPEFSAA